jgi:hypothetical protein
MGFALETENEKAKRMYEMDGKRLQDVLQKLEPYLLR